MKAHLSSHYDDGFQLKGALPLLWSAGSTAAATKGEEILQVSCMCQTGTCLTVVFLLADCEVHQKVKVLQCKQ